MLLAIIADKLSALVWLNSKDGQDGKNRPKSILAILTGKEETNADDVLSFASANEFELARARILGEIDK